MLYDGFNVILLRMTDALIECGATQEIKDTVLTLWAAYLHNLQVAFLKVDDSENSVEESIASESDAFLPNWMNGEKEDECTSASEGLSTSMIPFVPQKK